MKFLGKFQYVFPETPEEAKTWTPDIEYKALASKVLVAAKTRVEGTWKAYCDAIPGKKHSEEWQEVLKHGDQLSEKVARAIFPRFEGIPYAD